MCFALGGYSLCLGLVILGLLRGLPLALGCALSNEWQVMLFVVHLRLSGGLSIKQAKYVGGHPYADSCWIIHAACDLVSVCGTHR